MPIETFTSQASLFSPGDNGEDLEPLNASALSIIANPSPAVRGQTSLRVVVQNRIGQDGGRTTQVLQYDTDASSWTDQDIRYLTQLSGQISGTAPPLTGNAAADFAAGIPIGIRTVVDYIMAANPADGDIPPQYKGLLDRANAEAAVRRGGGGPTAAEIGGAANVLVGAGLAMLHPTVRAAVNVMTDGAVALFRFLRLFAADVPHPPGLTLNGTYLGPLGISSKKIRSLLDALPPGSCAIEALAYGGVPHKHLRDLNPEEWVGASVKKLEDWLVAHGYAFEFYDQMGRLQLSGEAGPTAPKCQKTLRLLVHRDHVSAFKTRCTKSHPFSHGGVPAEGHEAQQISAMLEVSRKHFKSYYSANTWAVNLFFDRCGIRPPAWHLPCGVSKLQLDVRKCYPWLLTDQASIFPVFTDEVPEEWVEPRREAVSPTGFYLVDTTAWHPDEVAIVANGRRQAWVYGLTLIDVVGVGNPVQAYGRFIPKNFVEGKAIDMEAFRALVDVEDEPRESSTTFKNRVYGALRIYSGLLLKHTSSSLLLEDQITRESRDYHAAACLETRDSTTILQQGRTPETVTCTWWRERAYHTTGRPAMLAIYQLAARRLLELTRSVKRADPRARLTRVKTDSVAFDTNAVAEDLVDEHGYFLLGTNPGDFQKEAVAYIGDRELQPAYIASIIRRPIADTSVEELLLDIKEKRSIRTAIVGPPGSGKTHLLTTKIIPALLAAGMEYHLATPYITHRDRLKADGITTAMTTDALATAASIDLQAAGVDCKGKVLIIDEFSLCQPHTVTALELMKPTGIIVIGDDLQLRRSIDILETARFLELSILRLDFHSKDRYGGNTTFHSVLNRVAVDIRANETRCTRALIDDIKELGVRFANNLDEAADAAHPRNSWVVLGWRHSETDCARQCPEKHEHTGECPLRYKDLLDLGQVGTVHGSQGMTLDADKSLFIADWDYTDPRVLYTAMSRVGALGRLVLRAPSTRQDSDA